MNLFIPLENSVIKEVVMHTNERAFSFYLENEDILLFKMFGNRSNLIHFQHNKVSELFRDDLKNDWSMSPGPDRIIQQDLEHLKQHNGDYRKLFPTFGKYIRGYLEEKAYYEKSTEQQWTLIQTVLTELNNGEFVVTEEDIRLSLLPEKGTKFTDPVQALNYFFQHYFMSGVLNRERKSLRMRLEKNQAKTARYIRKLKQKLHDLQNRDSYRHKADLLMAHLHEIPKGTTEVTLPDFYDPERHIKISLNPVLSIQENAGNFYQKAKNQHLETGQLEANIRRGENKLEEIKGHLTRLESIHEIKELREYMSREGLLEAQDGNTVQSSLPYREFTVNGFVVRVGKNAKGNDEMLQKYSYKDDLWLHAKDVSGSHVLIKYQAGKVFPAPVIEEAASAAAFYSRRKNDTLCPVIVTPRKYVRKRKGDPPGLVVVDREEKVILVPPVDPGE